MDDYDSLEETIEAVCDNKFVLYYELGILTSADEDDNDEEEEGEATLEEMKEEAIRRLKLFTKMEPCVINEFKGDNILYMSENRGILYYLDDEEKKLVKNVEADGDRLVFHVLHYSSQFGEMYTMLYVYNDKSEWAECRENLKNCGISYCYTYNKDEVFTTYSMDNYKLSIDLLLKVLSNTREVYRNIASHDKKVSKVDCDSFISTFLTKDKELSSILDLFRN